MFTCVYVSEDMYAVMELSPRVPSRPSASPENVFRGERRTSPVVCKPGTVWKWKEFTHRASTEGDTGCRGLNKEQEK